MKKTLYLISSTLLTTSAITPITILTTQKTNSDFKTQDVEGQWTNSFGNLIKTLNTKYTNIKNLENNLQVDALINSQIANYYKTSFDQQTGTIRSWETKLVSEQKDWWTFDNTFRNNSNFEQVYSTESFTKEVTNSHTFTLSLTEKNSTTISIKSKFDTLFTSNSIQFSDTFEISAGQEWSDTKTETVNVAVPSQTIKVSPHSLAKVLYTIEQGIYATKGVINFEVQSKDLAVKNFLIPHFYFKANGNFQNNTWEKWSVLDIVKTLKELGHLNQLQKDSSQYSIVTVDNIENPSKYYLNLPISWVSSQGGKLNVSNEEEPLL